jgi:hypothetical protein
VAVAQSALACAATAAANVARSAAP